MLTQKWTDEFLNQKRLIADPLADTVIKEIVAEKGTQEARRLFDLLIRNVEMPLDEFPPLIQDYLNQTKQLPSWTDWNKVALAHELFLDHGPKFLICLYYKSLPILYSCANGAKVLVKTSRLTNQTDDIKIFTRRIAETGQFLMDVMTSGQLKTAAKGIKTTQKIRLIHASIRHFIQQNQWDESALGKPINQEDMAITLMTFSISLIDALQQFGIEEDQNKLDAFLHTWTAIGALLGVHEDLLPSNLEQARTLINTIQQRQSKESEAGKLLTKALISFAEQTLPSDKLDIAPSALIQFMVGPELAKILGIQPNYGCLSFLLPEILASYFKIGEKLEDKVGQPLNIFFDAFSRKVALAMVDFFDEYKGRSFDIPELLKKRWF